MHFSCCSAALLDYDLEERMSDLTAEELQERITRVTADLDQLSVGGDMGRKLEVLTQYKEYLEEQLQELTGPK